MSLGFGQILLLIILVLLVFGAGKLPRVMEDVAKGVKAFRKGLADDVPAQKTDEATPAEKDKDAA